MSPRASSRDAPPYNGVPPSKVFQLAAIVTVLVSALCVVAIVLSSRHLYANKFFPKMPLLASVCWLASCLSLLTAVSARGDAAIYLWSYLSWTTDVSARSLLLWFTYIRTATLWPGAYIVKYTAFAIQLIQLVSCVLVMYKTSADKASQASSVFYKTAVTVYALTDLLPVLLDAALIHRLWALKLQLVARRSSSPFSRIKLMFFYFAIVCIVLVAAISVTIAAITITGNDPFFCFANILFAFRILLTDVFSNLIRDSLIEQHTTEYTKPPAHAAPPPSADKHHQGRHDMVRSSTYCDCGQWDMGCANTNSLVVFTMTMIPSSTKTLAT